MLPTRIFRNRWHALLFAGVICVLAAEFASDASIPPSALNRPETPKLAKGDAPAAVAASPADSGPSLFADLFASQDAGSGPPARMLPLDTDGDGIADSTAREVR